jgi:hypothetical protein
MVGLALVFLLMVAVVAVVLEEQGQQDQLVTVVGQEQVQLVVLRFITQAAVAAG